jgi:pyruvate ferredoxin oxidoreductase alpha subunit
MHEVLGVAAGCRQPIVMAVVNRALLAPWNIWGDQSDAMGARDQGWLSLFAETAQEALDLVIMGYRIAEDQRVLLPLMVNIDGFFLSHVTEVLWLPDHEEVDSFLPRRSVSPVRLDLDEPMVVNPLTPPSEYTEVRRQHSLAMEASRRVMDEVMADFAQRFHRFYCQADSYGRSDADLILIGTGSVCATIRHLLQECKLYDAVRLIKLTTFRPFPTELLRSLCQGARAVGVIERSPALGHDGPLTSEVRAALYGLGEHLPVIGFVAGLGGRDIPPATINRIVESLSKVKDSSPAPSRSLWIDLREETASHEC